MNSLENLFETMMRMVLGFLVTYILLTVFTGCVSYPITPDMEQELERNKDKITEPNIPLPPRRV